MKGRGRQVRSCPCACCLQLYCRQSVPAVERPVKGCEEEEGQPNTSAAD